MSYSLLLIRALPGTSDDDVEKIAIAATEAEEARPAGAPDPEIERQKRAVVEALLEECPELDGGEPDYAAIARAENISEDEARQRYHWWSVAGPDDGPAIEITLYDSYVSIDASRVGTDQDWEDLWRYLEILVREGGFVVWDPQGPNVVDLADGPFGDGRKRDPAKPAKRRGGGKRSNRGGGDAARRPTEKSLGDADGATGGENDRHEDDGDGDVPDEDTRRGGEIGKLINRIIDGAIAAPLAAAGFRRAGRTWRRHLDDGVIQVVNVQWSARDSVEGWFTLNAGVYFPALAKLIAEFPVTDSPKEYDCHVRKRPLPVGRGGWTVRVPGATKPDPDVKGLIGNFFSWLDRRADHKAAEELERAPRELREALDQHAFPWLQGVSTLRGARDELTRRGPAFWGAHVSLLLGEREEAARIVERELARANPEFAETIRTWARAHGLIA